MLISLDVRPLDAALAPEGPLGRALATAQRELPQIFPAAGWVEHDPEEIWRATLAVGREAAADRCPRLLLPHAQGERGG